MKRILFIQYTNPAAYPPLQHSSRIMAEAGWSVLFLGTGAMGANALEFEPHCNIRVRRMTFCRAGWRQKLHFVKFCLWVLWTALAWQPRWVYASDRLSCPAAAVLTWFPGIKVLYHEHDSPDNDAHGNRFNKLLLRTRRWLAKRADICILPNVKRLERFEAELGPLRSAVCVWNCPAISEVAIQPRKAAEPPVSVLYHGSIVPERLPPTVLDALTLLPSTVRLRVVGYETGGSRGYVMELRRRAQALGIEDQVDFLDTIPQRADLLAITLNCDIGLALMPMESTDQNCQTMTGASNKAFEYLACGLPLIVSDLSDWRAMFVEPGYARPCDPKDPRSIATAIASLVNDPERMRAMGEAGRQKIKESWNYETLFQPVMRLLSSASSPESVARVNQRLEDVH
jgi:glycosyltransferase involved in cell wall biosynthesis